MSDDLEAGPLDSGDVGALAAESLLAPEEARIARRAFLSVFEHREPSPNDAFTDLMALLDDAARGLMPDREQRSTSSALAKLHGDWFEWLLCWAAEKIESDSQPAYIAIRLPNVLQFDSALLYEATLAQMIESLRNEVRKSGVELITSNPDFFIVRNGVAQEDAVGGPIKADSLERFNGRFHRYVGQCAFEDIRAYLAAKYTVRPDRRLQMPHEGSLMKALYVHLQTRLWITEPAGLSFYAVASKVGEADRRALRTVATHSITSVASRPQPAVDAVFQTETVGDALEMFSDILRAPNGTSL